MVKVRREGSEDDHTTIATTLRAPLSRGLDRTWKTPAYGRRIQGRAAETKERRDEKETFTPWQKAATSSEFCRSKGQQQQGTTERHFGGEAAFLPSPY